MSAKCKVCGKNINKNQEREQERIVFNDVLITAHKECALGVRKIKKYRSHSRGHCKQGGAYRQT